MATLAGSPVLPSTPYELFERWMNDVLALVPSDGTFASLWPHAMTLATHGVEGAPAARVVFLAAFDTRGFSFFTHEESRKVSELRSSPRAALVFFWPPLERQVRVEGRVEQVSNDESDRYFKTRSRELQVSAWVSHQSREIADLAGPEEELRLLRERFEGREIARPPQWVGFRVNPHAIEFWQSRPNRLHDRFLYTQFAEGGWKLARLSP